MHDSEATRVRVSSLAQPLALGAAVPSHSAAEAVRASRSTACTVRRLLYVACAAAFLIGMQKFGGFASGIFYWAEEVVDPESRAHMALFVLVSLVFHIPSPVPLMMTAWCIAAGCFFGTNGFVLLLISFVLGVPMSFLIGRALAAHDAGDGTVGFASGETRPVARCIDRLLPSGATAYMHSLRSAIAKQPTKLSFLLMWAPLPMSMCPFLVGFIAPASELGIANFLLGALPSKLLHFTCHVVVGIEAGSFARATGEASGGGGGGGGGGSAEGGGLDGAAGGGPVQSWARIVAIGGVVVTVALIGLTARVVHHELEMARKRALQDEDRGVGRLSR
jgi:hypothetical protein